MENCEPLILGVNKRVFVGCGLPMNVACRAREPLRPTQVNPEHNIDVFHLIYGSWAPPSSHWSPVARRAPLRDWSIRW